MNQRPTVGLKTAWRRKLTHAAPLLIAGGSAVLLIIGSVGPWARVPGYSSVYRNGAENGEVLWVYGAEATGIIPLIGDGMAPLILGSIAGVLILWRLVRPHSSAFLLLTVFILLMISGAVGAVDWANAANIPRANPAAFFPGDVEPSWGLMMTALSPWPGVASTAYQLWRDELR